MDITIKPGKYVVAVSGGVDSMVLLDLLRQQPDLELVIAHYNHGMRPDAHEDEALVSTLAKRYGEVFYTKKGDLGPTASEALARKRRYEFLRQVKDDTKAKAIVTAHHQDDLIETVIINMLRGTGRRGFSSLKSHDDIVRPLLKLTKQELIHYAQSHKLAWREDPSNTNTKYLRNYVRTNLVSKLTAAQRNQLLGIIHETTTLNETLDPLLNGLLQAHTTETELDRAWFVSLPHTLSREVLLVWLRRHGIQQLDRRRIEQIVVLAKTLPHGKLVDVDAGHQLKITTTKLALSYRDR